MEIGDTATAGTQQLGLPRKSFGYEFSEVEASYSITFADCCRFAIVDCSKNVSAVVVIASAAVIFAVGSAGIGVVVIVVVVVVADAVVDFDNDIIDVTFALGGVVWMDGVCAFFLLVIDSSAIDVVVVGEGVDGSSGGVDKVVVVVVVVVGDVVIGNDAHHDMSICVYDFCRNAGKR